MFSIRQCAVLVLLFGGSALAQNVSIGPSSATRYAGQTQQFTATVSGGGMVTWSVTPSDGGTVSSSGLYSTPTVIPTQRTVTVIATNAADATKTASATITLQPLTISMSPASANLYSGQTQQFTATIQQSNNTGVTWSISPGGMGSVSSSGLYTTPASIPVQTTVTVTAASTADPSKTTSSTMTLQPLTISMSPSSSNRYAGQTQQFSATIQKSNNTNVTWSINPVGVGAVSSTGLYTAPAAVPQSTAVTVIAASVSDPTKTASATVSLTPLTISMSPASANLNAGQTQQFNAQVNNNTNTAVTWSISPLGVGTVSASGLYTAPALPGSQRTVTVTATSAADPTKTTSSTVSIVSPVFVNPDTAVLSAGRTQQFTATVTGLGNTAVTWSLTPSVGTIVAGLYTAPATITSDQTITVIATSVQDATKRASATVLLSAGGSTGLVTLMSVGDAYLRSGQANQNFGSATFLRVQDSGDNRALVRFDQGAIANAMGTLGLVSAKLRFYIASNGNNWGSTGATVAAHRLTATWAESGATWNCPTDTNTSNSSADCTPTWDMGSYPGWPFVKAPANAKVHTNGLTGWVEWDVTSDVAAFLAGTANYGWVVRKADENASGQADYSSREGSFAPQLVLSLGTPPGPQPPSPTLISSADTYLRSGSSNQNQGYETILQVQDSGNNRALVRFSQTQIEAYIGSGALTSARLRLNIIDNSNNWGTSGRQVNAHRLTQNWTEQGATWSCPDDTDPFNSAKNCTPDWNMAQSAQWPFVTAPTATMLQQSNQTGWVEFDVTADVAAFLAGTSSNYGWIVRKDDEGQAGQVSYSSREGSFPPELVLTKTTGTPVSVSVTPATVSLNGGGTQQFTAAVTGTSNASVTWSVAPATGAGTISATGLYTAPAIVAVQTPVTVTATSVADATKSGTAAITLLSPVIVSVTVSPATISLNGGGTQQFTAAVTGSANTAVTWTISPATGVGTISATGFYTAPATVTAQTPVTVTATSAADPSKAGTATVTLSPPVSVTVSPSTISLTGGQTQQFTAAVTGLSSTAVTWSISPVDVGSISASGLYTAPYGAPTQVTVRATSQANSTKSGTAIVTLSPPAVDSTSEVSALVGETKTIRIWGLNTNFATGVTAVRFGPGISVGGGPVGDFGPAVVQMSSMLDVMIVVAPDAAVGPRDITVRTGAEVVTRVGGFAISNISISVSPASPTVIAGNTVQFQANVTGTANTGVSWAIGAGGTGTVSSTGLFTAAASDVVTTTSVIATSLAESTRSAIATITMNPAPQVYSVSPSTLSPGADTIVEIRGAYANFVAGQTVVTLGAGVHVGGAAAGLPGPVTVVASDMLLASVVVDSGAALGARTVTIQTGSELVTAAAEFALENPPPAAPITLGPASPVSVASGEDVTLTASGIPAGDLLPVMVAARLRPASGGGAPIEVAIRDINPAGTGQQLIFPIPAYLTVDTDTPYLVGIRGATTNGDEPGIIFSSSNEAAFTLKATKLLSITPASGQRGQRVKVSIQGSNTHFVPGLSVLDPGPGIQVEASTVGYPLNVLSPTSAEAVLLIQTGAALGARSITVRTFEQELVLTNAFLVGPAPITLSLTEPSDLTFTNITPVTVRGIVSATSATVTVNGVAAPLSGNAFLATVPLVEGNNVIQAKAVDASGHVVTNSTRITLDTTPPRVSVVTPAEGTITTAASITVSGTINDIVIGTVNGEQATVTVNGVPALVANRSFLATAVPLTVGSNTIQVVGRDRTGNSATSTVIVHRAGTPKPEIRILSGNSQTGTVLTPLGAALVAQLTDTSGIPVAGRPVIFKVAQGNGSLSTAGGTGTVAFHNGAITESVVVKTDSLGRATVNYTLGARAGAGAHRVEASAANFSGKAVFVETATAGVASRLILDTGNHQIGAMGAPLEFPYVVVATDSSGNRLGGVPISFAVTSGGGRIDGQPQVMRTTDSDGRAAVVLELGEIEGFSKQVVEASIPGNANCLTAFVSTALRPGDPAATTISGVVLTNTNQPLAGVTMRLFRAYQGNSNNVPVPAAPIVQTDAQGQFIIPAAPVGVFKLIADGATASPAAHWPTLEYDISSVAGQNNTVGSPIFLPELDQVHKLCVTETAGGILTLPDLPGFSLKVAPGSVTFAGGTRSGCVSVSAVHMDRIPMAPSFGVQPSLSVTIQPVGAVFSPPAAISLPNVDGMAPRSVVEMMSYDHDLSQFVTIGTGTVSDDGVKIVSDIGVGILKAGWMFGGGQPPQTCTGTCPECHQCQNGTCQYDEVSRTLEIANPPDNPNPSADVMSNFSFLRTTTTHAEATVTPAGDASSVKWTVTPRGIQGAVRTGEGATFDFAPNPPAHNAYTRANGSLNKSTPLSYSILAMLCNFFMDTNVITQDERDVMRQEYQNHGIDIPTRAQLQPLVGGGHFTREELSSTPYLFAWGNPLDLAESVRTQWNILLNGDVQIHPLGTTGLLPGVAIIASSTQVIPYIGTRLLHTRPCNGRSPCDDLVVNGTITAGVNGRADTEATHGVDFPVRVNSGYRSPEHNQHEGGVVGSDHQFGAALDLRFYDPMLEVTGNTRAQAWSLLYYAAQRSIGNRIQCEDGPASHADCDAAGVNHVHVARR